MRKAILAVLAVLCSVGTTDETTGHRMLADKEPGQEQEMVAQCSGSSSRRTRTRNRRADDDEKQTLARCGGRKGRRCTDCTSKALAGKCKDGNCKRPGRSMPVA